MKELQDRMECIRASEKLAAKGNIKAHQLKIELYKVGSTVIFDFTWCDYCNKIIPKNQAKRSFMSGFIKISCGCVL